MLRFDCAKCISSFGQFVLERLATLALPYEHTSPVHLLSVTAIAHPLTTRLAPTTTCPTLSDRTGYLNCHRTNSSTNGLRFALPFGLHYVDVVVAPGRFQWCSCLFPSREDRPDEVYDVQALYTRPRPLGALTMTGALQARAAGAALRHRYVGQLQLLPSTLTDDNANATLYARSTGFPRTVQTAQNVLFGLYPPPAVNWLEYEQSQGVVMFVRM